VLVVLVLVVPLTDEPVLPEAPPPPPPLLLGTKGAPQPPNAAAPRPSAAAPIHIAVRTVISGLRNREGFPEYRPVV
jgi:hypothetical protein